MRTKSIITGLFCLPAMACFAQRDTTKKQSIDITSSYKPVLRNAVKINFSATNLTADTVRQVSPYAIPAQNLFYTYQPMTLKPLALTQDTSLDMGSRNFLKAGFGNYSTPYINAGFSFGDGKKSLVNVYADYISSKGKIKNQDYSKMNLKASGSYFTDRTEVYGSAGVSQYDYYLYGYDHALHNYNKNDLLQRLTDVKLKGGFRNKDVNESGINYNPNIEINVFTNQKKLMESSLLIEAPVEKKLGDIFSVKVVAKADITSYTTQNYMPDNIKFNNNIFSIAPELIYTTPELSLHGGLTPAWDNGKLSVLPNFYGEAQIPDKSFLVQAGFTGRFIKNSYQNLTSINPYLSPLTSPQPNTTETELYGGIKASVGKHFNFSAKGGVLRYKNLPFFINDTAIGSDSKSFKVSDESKLADLRIHGDLSYINQDKFTITGGLTFNGYTGMHDNAKAWGTIPLQIDASLRWWAFKQVMIKSDFTAYTGSAYLLPGNINQTLGGAADLSAGVEVTINKKISAWLDINNIFNNKYQRWYGYEVYGTGVLAGVILKF
jgi:hypothetical protein